MLNERGVCKIERQLKVRLSLEPAYQIIYWSFCWLFFFLSLIGFLEAQHFSISIVLGLASLILLYFGLGSSLTLSEGKLTLRYFRGIKVTDYPVSNLTKLTFSEQRLIQMEQVDSVEPIIFYLNQKNKKHLLSALQHTSPALGIVKINTINLNKE